MNRGDARIAIQSTFEDGGGAPTADEINVWIDIEHKLLRRELLKVAPTLYTAVDTPQAISSPNESLTIPADFEALVRLERLYGVTYFPVDVSDALSTQIGQVQVREEGAALKVGPVLLAPATYRIVYLQKPLTLAGDSSALLVPDGCEDIIIERCAARARVKLEEDPSPHLARASATWEAQKRPLRKRYGRSPEPGLRMVRRW